MENGILFLCGVLGVVGHSLFKLDSLKKESKSVSMQFTFKNYIEEDFYSICFSFVSIVIYLLVFDQTTTQYPRIIGYSRISFVGCGWMGSYIIQYFFSSAQKRIKSIINEKIGENDKDK